MPRSYRGFVIAAVGWLTIAALPPRNPATGQHQQADSEIAQRLTDIDSAINNANATGDLNKPCDQHHPNRKSQLCAQWESADASKSSAIWTERTFWVGIGGGVIGFLALCAAGAAAIFARAAVLETRRIGEVQTRAYLSIEEVCGVKTSSGVGFDIEVSNAGQSPALEVMVKCAVVDPDGVQHPIIQDASDQVPAGGRRTLARVYFTDEACLEWNALVARFWVGYADVFERIYDVRGAYVGSPRDWLTGPGQMVHYSHIASITAAGLVDDD